MNKSSLLTLAQYNQWANQRILRKVGALSAESLHTTSWLSRKSLWNTLLHTVDVQYSWRVACQTGELPPLLTNEQFATIKNLRSFWQDDDAQLVAYADSLTDAELNATVQFTFAGSRSKPRHGLRWHILYHAVNHGTHHRSEIGQYLDTLNRSPGDMDFLKFVNRKQS